MRAQEFLTESEDVRKLIPFMKEIRRILGTDKFKLPYVHFVDGTGLTWAGQCMFEQNFGYYQMEIQLSDVLKDENDIKRVLAHELCHDAEYLLHWLPLIIKRREAGYHVDPKKFIIDFLDNHGPQWQKAAAKVNAVFGPNYVTRATDKTYMFRAAWDKEQEELDKKQKESDTKVLSTIPRYYNAGKRRAPIGTTNSEHTEK